MADVSENQFQEVILEDVSNNENGSPDSNDNVLNFENAKDILINIQENVSLMVDSLSDDVPSVFSSDRRISIDSLDAYYFLYQGEIVYIPFDKIDYFSVTNQGELINISSQTISCYSLDWNGNVLNQYRFSPFSKAQKYVYGYNGNNYQTWYWTSISVPSSNSNLILGQTGISNITDFLLFGILFFVGVLALFKKGR